MDKNDTKAPLIARPPPCQIETLDQLTEETLTQIMKHYFKESNLRLKIIDDGKSITGLNDNFQSEINKWKIEINIGNTSRTMSIVVKTPPASFLGRMMGRAARQLFTETFWYKHAYPVLSQQFPEIANISPQLYFGCSNYEDSHSPSCCDKMFGANAIWCRKDEKGMLLMENVCEENRHTGLPAMITLDKKNLMSAGHMKVALKTLAKFHGAWWLWLHGQKGKEDSSAGLMNYRDVETAAVTMKKLSGNAKQWIQGFQPIYKSCKSLLAAPEKASTLAKIRHYWKTQVEFDLNRILIDTALDDSLMKTINHGDYWNNNMMFSSTDGDHPDLSVTLIDFQGIGLRHPAMDIWYLMYTATDRAFREIHLQDCLQTYFNVFSQYIAKQDEVKISFDKFCAELDSRRLFPALVWAPNATFLVLNPEKVGFDSWAEYKETGKMMIEKLGNPEPPKDEHPLMTEIRRRKMETVEELVDLGLL